MSTVSHHPYNQHQLRVVTEDDGRHWFVFADLGRILGYSHGGQLAARLDPDTRSRHVVPSRRTETEVVTVTESGMVDFVARCRKPEARRFLTWINTVLLPTLRDNTTIYHFDGHPIRILIIDNTPWWVAADLQQPLALTHIRTSLGLLDDDEKGVQIVDTLGGPQQHTVVSEAGLYSLIFRSRKPEAKQFKRWVTHEVLPAIRRRGGLLSPTVLRDALNDPDFIIGLATSLKEERAARTELEAQRRADAPKVKFAEAVTAYVAGPGRGAA